MSATGRRARWSAGALALAATAVLVAGCGTTPAPNPPSAPLVPASSGTVLDSSASSANGTSWAVVKMGDSADPVDNFWELFVRPDATTSWKLVTPAGVASNGGIVMAPTGATSLVTGFLPSQKLTFSPLAVTADGGAQWAQNNLLTPGFGEAPFALSAGASGQLLALTDGGNAEVSTNAGSSWRTVTTQQALAGLAAARSCGIRSLTAATWTSTGAPLVGANCNQPGVVGIFELSGRGWRRAGPPLPASLSHDAVDVIGLATNALRTTAVLAARSATATMMLAAWSADGGATWRLSPTLAAGSSGSPSVSIWADGSAGLVLPGDKARSAVGATIGWQSAGWHALPLLPARTATLATGPGGQLQALVPSGTALTAWQLGASTNHWTPTQTIRVPIPYGSSG